MRWLDLNSNDLGLNMPTHVHLYIEEDSPSLLLFAVSKQVNFEQQIQIILHPTLKLQVVSFAYLLRSDSNEVHLNFHTCDLHDALHKTHAYNLCIWNIDTESCLATLEVAFDFFDFFECILQPLCICSANRCPYFPSYIYVYTTIRTSNCSYVSVHHVWLFFVLVTYAFW